MKFSPLIVSYLNGNKFSNALQIPYKEVYEEKNRLEILVELCRDKRVLHIGCADHLPLINKKIEQGKWLHALLCEVATECTGIDINTEAVEFMTRELKLKDIYHADITQALPEKLIDRQWDVVVMGEILEHIDNPVHFLQQLKHQLQPQASELIITVPNSFNRLFKNDIQRNTEDINSDHMYHFTPYTLGRVMYKSGFTSLELLVADRVALPYPMKLTNRFKKIFGINSQYSTKYFATLIAISHF